MYIDNITSKGITLNEIGKLMQIEVYEKQIQELTNNWNELEEWLDKVVKITANIDEKMTCKNVLGKMKEIKEKNK